MGFDDDFLRELLSTFVAEAQEHLDAATNRLLDLERGLAGAQAFQHWADVFRELHSLKGAARAMNLERIESVSHRLETLFGRARNGEINPTPAFYTLVYRALDALCDLVRESGGLTPAAKHDLADLLAQLDIANTAAEVALAPPPVVPPPPSAPPIQVAPPSREAPTAPPAPPAAPAAPADVSPGPAAPVEESVRVATAKLEALMAQMGELQVARLGAEQRGLELRSLLDDVEVWEAEQWARRTGPVLPGADRGNRALAAPASTTADTSLARLREVGGRLRSLQRRYDADQRRLTQVMAALQDNVRRMRMLPISTVFGTFPRMVRDLAHDLGKEVRLVIQGGDTEVDRSVLEQIKDPLTHLLRNSLDHGIELPQARQLAGKPVEGTITLSAAHGARRGDSIIIEVSDDGQGIDVARVRASAVKKGGVSAAEAAAMSEHEALWLIFRSGVSTSAIVSDVSGRGVGMDVVRDKVERLHGLIDVQSALGAGARFTLTLPLTVSTTLCLLVQAAGQTFAVPITNVIRIVSLGADSIGYAEGQAAIRPEGQPILLLNLAQVLGLATGQPPAPKPGWDGAPAASDLGTAIILGSAEKRLAFRVDAVTNAQEVVVKPLPKPFLRVRYLVGASILGTGEVVLVINAADLLRASAPVSAPQAAAAPPEAARARTVMVVDDSITTRTLEKNILEAAGFAVRAYADGLEAWNALQTEGCAPDGLFDLLVSDVSMPRLNGFELTLRVRGDQRLKNLPVVLVTSLDSREDRERGVQAGADAYITKGAFDQDNLLETIRRLI
jgi:two-component system chemotaxis sensor kinase CheA